jgi:tetratricopeptide (TPR) repeat protein
MTVPTRRRWFVVVGATLLLAGGAAGAWKWFHRSQPPDPPLPADIQDAEVLQAIERARQKVLDKPHEANAWGYLGKTLLANLFDREADRCFAEAARLDLRSPDWPYGRGLIALRKDPDNAVPFLRKALAATGDFWPEYQSAVRLQLAEALLERHELEEAEQLFRTELARNSGNPRAALGLGLVALVRGDEQAAENFLSNLRSNPSAQKKATALLATLARSRNDNAAAAGYDRDTAALPDDEGWPDPFRDEVVGLQVGQRAFERQVTRLERQRHYKEAADMYLTQLEKKPTVPTYIGAGINLARLGNYEPALRLLHEALRLDADSAQAHYTLALVQFMRAEKEWLRSPGSAQAKEWLRDTVTHGQRAAELKPDNARNYLHWGLALKYLGEPAAAIAPLRKGVACRPADFDLQLALGEVLLETGQYQEAETYLENAKQLEPDNLKPIQALKKLRKMKDY